MKNINKFIIYLLAFTTLNLTFSTFVFAGLAEDVFGDDDIGGLKARKAARAAIGMTDENQGQMVAESKAFFTCEDITKEELETDRTFGDFMKQCANGIVDPGGCKLNFESACVNGRSVPMIELSEQLKNDLINSGFEPIVTSGYSAGDFSDASRMYEKVRLKDGAMATLCSQVPGFNALSVDGNLPTAKIGTVVESTPAIFKPQLGMGGISVHTIFRVVAGPDGNPKYQSEVQLRRPSLSRPIDRDGDTRPYKVSAGNGMGVALTSDIILGNMVKCKKGRHTFDNKTKKQFNDVGTLTSVPIEVKKSIAKSQSEYYEDAESRAGLNVNAAKSAFFSVFGLSSSDPALTEAPSQEIAPINPRKAERGSGSAE